MARESRDPEFRSRDDRWPDEKGRWRGEERWRDEPGFRSGRQGYQAGQPDYGRGREGSYREDYDRGGEYYGRGGGYESERQGLGWYGGPDHQAPYPGYGPSYGAGWGGTGYRSDWQGGGRGYGPYGPDSGYGPGRGWRGGEYPGRGDYGREAWSRPEGGYGERSMWDRATDEVSSWLGDEEAERRRQMDQFRGRGPKNFTRSDDRIREDVCDRLSDDPRVDASDIDVKVSGAEVTLTGTVHARDQRRRAEDCAEHVSGVKHVQNNLRVKEEASTTGSGEVGSVTARAMSAGSAASAGERGTPSA